MTTHEQEAERIIELFLPHSNWGKMEDEDVQMENAKACAEILCNKMIEEFGIKFPPSSNENKFMSERKGYWNQVLEIIKSKP